MSRVDSVEIAIKKAGDRARGSVLASDAFFPFADSIEQAAAAGIAAIIQPGGSTPRRRSHRRGQSLSDADDFYRPAAFQTLNGRPCDSKPFSIFRRSSKVGATASPSGER